MKNLRVLACVCVLCASAPYLAEELDLTKKDRVAEPHNVSSASHPARGYLGFVPRYEQAENGIRGIRVLEIAAKSPAQRSGLTKDDLIIAFNGVPFLFESNLEMMRKLGSVRAGTRLELTLLRGSETHEVELLPTDLPPDRARDIAGWMKRAEASREKDACVRDRAKKDAFRAFKQSIPETGVEVIVTKDLATHEILIGSQASITIPPQLDLSQLPLLDGLIRDLLPGDSLQLFCVLGESGNELRIRPLVVPPYLRPHLTGELSPIVRR